jgi:sulfotransferase family protein
VKGIDVTLPAPAIPGPNIIGGTGGSGTRVVARIVRDGGMFIGTNLNKAEDALDFADHLDRWINVFLASKMSASSPPSRDAMTRDLQRVLEKHLAPLHPTARAWGWKEPRSMFLLPFFHSQFPKMRFLHVIRDGRDIAYSTNQNQLRKHGRWLLDTTELRASESMQSLALWSRANLVTADYGENILRAQYLRIRFEDLCYQPVPVIIQIFEFFGLIGEVDHIARIEVRPPDSLGRWRTQERDTLAELHRVGHVALERFGYHRTLE